MLSTIARMTGILVLGGVVAATPGIAGVSGDHLTCFKIKDSNTKTNAVINLTPTSDDFPVTPGCTLKTRSKELCTPSSKAHVDPPSPVEDVGGEHLENSFLCYKMKCPKLDVSDMAAVDQFGARTVSGFKTKRLCVPAETSVVTTTTLPVTTTTLPVTTTLDATTTTIAPTTTVPAAVCGDGMIEGSEECDDAPPAENGDGCSAQCLVESGFICSGQPSVCLPL
ncbi:MAG TPA: hypothetical protein VEC57_17615 [Candidatus Limnocylindrales bacterium]|nr:hypothetical protein [Candidatus Limnocylindrales bacterium]